MVLRENLTRYEVYDGGRVFDKKRHRDVKIFKSNKYLQCCVVDNFGVTHTVGVHSLVALFYCPDYFDGCVVHHIDENTHNNWSYNLCCESRSEHSRHHARNDMNFASWIKTHGPANKGTKMSEEFRQKCRQSAIKRGFNGNQFIDKDGNRRNS